MRLRTPDAARHLQVSESFLKRKRDIHGGFLVGGEHYFLGASTNASIIWDVDAIARELHKHGQLARMNTATNGNQPLQQLGA